ncbi:MAG: hypothetical protein WEH44_07350, partial [Pirellulaceae bacterium]
LEQLKRTPLRAYTIAAWIKGKEKEGDAAQSKDDKTTPAAKESKNGQQTDPAAAEPAKPRPINVIYVADIDQLGNQWLQMRNAQGLDQFRWDNGPFVLNMVDAVAGDDRFLAIRQRKPRYSTLQRIEKESRLALEDEDERAEDYLKKFNEEKTKLEDNVKKIEKKLTDLREENERKRNAGEEVDEAEQQAQEQILALQYVKADSDAKRAVLELQRKRDKDLENIRRERDQTVRSVQNEYKLWSVAIPPIPPLLVGFIVFVRRRLREREGISKARMKY